MPEGAQSIGRAVEVLRLVASRRGGGIRLQEVVQATGLTKSTAHRILSALVETGLLEQDELTGSFVPGLDLVALGSAAADRHGLDALASSSLDRLARRTGDTVYLSMRRGFECICLDRALGDFPVKTLTLRVGDTRPLGVGAGSLALLAAASDDDVDRSLEANAAAIRSFGLDRAELERLVHETRLQGFAANDELIVPGMTALGMAVDVGTGAALIALSVAAITPRLTGPRREAVLDWLREECAVLQERLQQVAGDPRRVPSRPGRATRAGADLDQELASDAPDRSSESGEVADAPGGQAATRALRRYLRSAT